MGGKGSSAYRGKIKESKEYIWNTFFKTGSKAFKRKDYVFHGMIKTDGVGVSVLFHRLDQDPRKLDRDDHLGHLEEKYIDALDNYDGVRGKEVVGIDVGMSDILHCTDGNTFYRYTANQRRVQTKRKKYAQLIQHLQKTKRVDGWTVSEWESLLSQYNKFSCTTDDFGAYIFAKNLIGRKLKRFYEKRVFRLLRWYSYINCQRSEAKMINQIKKKFGTPNEIVLAY